MKASETSFDARISEERAAWSACSDGNLSKGEQNVLVILLDELASAERPSGVRKVGEPEFLELERWAPGSSAEGAIDWSAIAGGENKTHHLKGGRPGLENSALTVQA